MIFGKNVNRYYAKYVLYYLIGLTALAINDIIQLRIPEIYRDVLEQLESTTSIENFMPFLTKSVLYIVIIAFLVMFGRLVWRVTLIGVGPKVEADLRDRMFRHSEKLSRDYFQQHKTGAQMALYTNDLQTIRMSFGWGALMLFDALFLGVIAYYKMWKVNYILALFCLIPMALICSLSLMIGKRMSKNFEKRQKAFESLTEFTQENFSGISVVKAFVKEVKEILAFKKVNQENVDKNISFVRFATVVQILLSATITLIFIIILGLGGYFVMRTQQGHGSFTLFQLQEFQLYFGALTWPMMAVAQMINLFAQGKASYRRVNAVLTAPIEITDPIESFDQEITGQIEFKNLNFKFFDSPDDVLKQISFSIQRGQTVGIIGRTGCGKSTIADLLLRIYNVEPGTLFLDGVDIMHYPFKQVRNAIGYVPQDNFLFSDTISNNIAFAYEQTEFDTIKRSAELADVHDNIMMFEHQYDTILGERGVTLSGGQKQRVSIARALIKNPPILILDDSLSAVDTKTEEIILRNIREIRQNKTTIFIAHRITTVQDLNQIIVMDEGRILDTGTHAELLQRCSLYQEMVRLQELEKLVEGGEIHES